MTRAVITAGSDRRAARDAEVATIREAALAAAAAGAGAYEGATGHVQLLAEELDSWRASCAALAAAVDTAHAERDQALAAAAGLAELVEAVRTAVADCTTGRDHDGDGMTCVVCGCTEQDCTGCADRTGQACWWVASDLCSACAPLLESARAHALGTHLRVAGVCPACGEPLILDPDGHVLCSALDSCPDVGAATRLLEGRTTGTEPPTEEDRAALAAQEADDAAAQAWGEGEPDPYDVAEAAAEAAAAELAYGQHGEPDAVATEGATDVD